MDFDNFKDDYTQQHEKFVSIPGVHQGPEFYSQVKAELLLEITGRHLPGLSQLKVLDIGCGIGLIDQFLIGKFGSLSGVDVARGVIDQARINHPSVDYAAYDGSNLPYADGSFDVVFTVCVLHHVQPEFRSRFLSEMKRVTRKGGLCFIFEHNPFNPLTLYVVNRCPFDDDAVLLKPKESRRLFSEASMTLLEQRFFLFFPWRGRIISRIEGSLGSLPLGAQYLVVARA